MKKKHHLETHGETGTREYETWKSILKKCYNSNCKMYKYYGARGIKVDPEWRIYENFRKDMGSKPKGYS